jgi:hypothetical protein
MRRHIEAQRLRVGDVLSVTLERAVEVTPSDNGIRVVWQTPDGKRTRPAILMPNRKLYVEI